MKNYIISIFILLSLIGCDKTDSKSSANEKMSVKYYLFNPDLIDSKLKSCKEDFKPKSSNNFQASESCMNASSALALKITSSNIASCYKNGIDKTCIENNIPNIHK